MLYKKLSISLYNTINAQNSSIFEAVCGLFKEKWKDQKEFLSYFVKVWLRPETCGWYQGFAKAIPDHNNSNETDNKYIKECQDRKRLGLIQFLNHAET